MTYAWCIVFLLTISSWVWFYPPHDLSCLLHQNLAVSSSWAGDGRRFPNYETNIGKIVAASVQFHLSKTMKQNGDRGQRETSARGGVVRWLNKRKGSSHCSVGPTLLFLWNGTEGTIQFDWVPPIEDQALMGKERVKLFSKQVLFFFFLSVWRVVTTSLPCFKCCVVGIWEGVESGHNPTILPILIVLLWSFTLILSRYARKW